MEAAKPLQPHQRGQFPREVADELARYPAIGVGVIGRVTAKIQRQHGDPVILVSCLLWGRVVGGSLRKPTLLQSPALRVVLMANISRRSLFDRDKGSSMHRKGKVDKP
jgi:hypothetical protein